MDSLVIKTSRLLLRPLAPADIDLALEMYTDTDVARYVGEAMTRDEVVRDFPKRLRRCGDGAIGVWCVTDGVSGEKLGTGVLLPLPVDAADTEWELLDGSGFPDREIEVGYVLRKAAWGRGIATETCRALLRFAFERTPLRAVTACTHPDKTASQRVLMKCGLRDNGPRRAYAEDGVPGFTIDKAEWLATGN